MTVFGFYALFGVPFLGLILGGGALWLVRRDATAEGKRVAAAARPTP